MLVDTRARISDTASMRVCVLPVGDTPKQDFERYFALLQSFSKISFSELSGATSHPPAPPFSLRGTTSEQGGECFVQLRMDRLAHVDEWCDLQPCKEVVGVVGVCVASEYTDLPAAHAEFTRAAQAHRVARHGGCYRMYVFEPPDSSGQTAAEELRHVVVIPSDGERLPFYVSTQLHDLANQIVETIDEWVRGMDSNVPLLQVRASPPPAAQAGRWV